MNKLNGILEDFSFLKGEGSIIIIGYNLKQIENSNLYEWYEVYIPKKLINQLSFKLVKDSIIADINQRTSDKILNEFVWNDKPVYLSKENLENYLNALTSALLTNGANLPIRFKLGEDSEGNIIYHSFTSIDDLKEFYLSCVEYIKDCLNKGWEEKDSIDWSSYKAFF